MPERTNADIIRIVNKWQAAGLMHELTCLTDPRHEALEPEERDGVVVLVCPTCARVHTHIPAAVLGSEAVIDYNLELFRRSAHADRIRAARQDIWFSVAVITLSCTVLPGLIGGVIYAICFGLIGAACSVAVAARSLRRLNAKAADLLPESPP